MEELNTCLLSPENILSAALRKGRADFNNRFVLARHAKPTLDPESFKDVLVGVVSPLVDKLAANGVIDLDPVVDILYDVSLELTGMGLLGRLCRQGGVAEALTAILPAAPQLVISDCARFVESVTNAAHNVARVPGADRSLWITEMARLVPMCKDVAEVREVGKVLAWRCGLAHYREGALEACENLGWKLASAGLGLAQTPQVSLPDFCQRLRQDPWLHPLAFGHSESMATFRIVRQCGGFRGFGGTFLRPPEVVAGDGTFFATDAEGWWIVSADVFGMTLTRCGDPGQAAVNRVPAQPTTETVLRNARDLLAGAFSQSGVRQGTESFSFTDDSVCCGVERARIEKPDRIKTYAWHGKTVLITTALSHKITALARNYMV